MIQQGDDSVRIETGDLKTLMRTIRNQIGELDKIRVRTDLQGRSHSAELAAAQRDLLFVSHLFDKARVLVMDEYHALRGRTSHLLED